MSARVLAIVAVTLGVLACPSASVARQSVDASASGTAAGTRQPGGGAESPEAVLERALSLFERGLETKPHDPEAARVLFEQAAASMDRARELAGVRNHRLLLNLGNAYLLAGDVGRAVLNLRRAERLRPTNGRVQAALMSARGRVGAALSPSAEERMRMALLAWRGTVPRSVLTWVVIAGYGLLWMLAIAKQFGRRTGGAKAAIGVGAISALALGMLWMDHEMMVEQDQGVVVSPGGIVGRNGPSEGVYEASFADPLPAGVEVRVLERRDRWARVRLLDGRETWVPEAALAII